MDSEHESGNINHSRADAGAIGDKGDVVDPLISVLYSNRESRSIRHQTADPESTVNEGALSPSKKMSSSSHSSLENFFQVDPKVDSKSEAPFAAFGKPHDNAELLPRDDKIGVSIETSFNSEEHGTRSTATSSEVSVLTNESTLHNMSTTQSPMVQVMERPGGNNPTGILSSTFATSAET